MPCFVDKDQGMIKVCVGDIGQKHAECNRQKEKRLKSAADRKIHQYKRDENHERLPKRQAGKAAVLDQRAYRIQKNCKHVVSPFNKFIQD